MSDFFRHITLLVFALTALYLVPSCSDDDSFAETSSEERVVTFCPSVVNSLPTRAMSNGKTVDYLIMKVYDNINENSDRFLISKELPLTEAKNGISLSLVKGRRYKILFFAQYKENTAYKLTDNGSLTVDYKDYLQKGFAGMEELDVFCVVEDFIVTENTSYSVTLTRPVAQLNIVDATLQPIKGVHTAKVTLEGIPTTLNLFTGNTSGSITQEFTFTDYAEMGEECETVSVTDENGEIKEAWYVTTNYVFIPVSSNVSAAIDLQAADGTSLKQQTVSNITLEKNKRTNVLGSIVMNPDAISEWDGNITKPEMDKQGRYVIDAASDLAWLQSNENILTEAGIFLLTTDIDMAGKEGKEIKSLQLPAGSTIKSEDAEKPHTIQNINITTGGLFGDATDLTVENLIVENIKADATTHVGTLVNTLKGDGTFTNVKVSNSSATTDNGASGGMVGYIVRKAEKDCTEKLTVTFNNCTVESNTIKGTMSEGHFVGLLSGYDNGEELIFVGSCQVNTPKNTVNSYYTESNKACFVEGYLSPFDGWVGRENYYRGIVKYNDVRFIPKWDGTTQVTPLTEGTTKLIYSAFDLASLQEKEHTAVTLKSDVDLGGNRDEKINPFTPIEQVTVLFDGGIYDANGKCIDEYAIYNLYIEETKEWTGFIREARSGTHKNLTFENSSVIVHYITTGTQDIGYAGTLTPYVNGATSYIVENINVNNGYVFGLGKIGGLVGYVTADTQSFVCRDCNIFQSTIKNEEGKTEEVFLDIAGLFQVKFYGEGEAGGMIGMIMGNTKIDNCHVSNSTMDCFGEDNFKMNILLAKVDIAGRHVNHFIGNVRTVGGSKTSIDNCTASDNTYITLGGKRKDTHSKGAATDLIGEAYFLYYQKLSGFKYTTVYYDTKGSVKVDGVEVLPNV